MRRGRKIDPLSRRLSVRVNMILCSSCEQMLIPRTGQEFKRGGERLHRPRAGNCPMFPRRLAGGKSAATGSQPLLAGRIGRSTAAPAAGVPASRGSGSRITLCIIDMVLKSVGGAGHAGTLTCPGGLHADRPIVIDHAPPPALPGGRGRSVRRGDDGPNRHRSAVRRDIGHARPGGIAGDPPAGAGQFRLRQIASAAPPARTERALGAAMHHRSRGRFRHAGRQVRPRRRRRRAHRGRTAPASPAASASTASPSCSISRASTSSSRCAPPPPSSAACSMPSATIGIRCWWWSTRPSSSRPPWPAKCRTKRAKLSLGAMTNLMCRGRKRGLAGVIATQRLAKLAKNVAAEASNFLMGRTFLDIDMARAADLLGHGPAPGRAVPRPRPRPFRGAGPGAVAPAAADHHRRRSKPRPARPAPS